MERKLTLTKLHTFTNNPQPDPELSYALPWHQARGSLAPFPTGVTQGKSLTRAAAAGLTDTNCGFDPHLLIPACPINPNTATSFIPTALSQSFYSSYLQAQFISFPKKTQDFRNTFKQIGVWIFWNSESLHFFATACSDTSICCNYLQQHHMHAGPSNSCIKS